MILLRESGGSFTLNINTYFFLIVKLFIYLPSFINHSRLKFKKNIYKLLEEEQ